MLRDRRHFVLNGLGREQKFKPKGQPRTKRPSDVVDRAAHAQALLYALDSLPDLAADKRPGVYLQVEGRPGEAMITKSLNASGLTLLKVRSGDAEENLPASATVFASSEGLEKLT